MRGNPQVVDLQPSGPRGVALSTPIAITFSETVNAATVNATNLTVRSQGSLTPISGEFLVLAGGQMAVFLPATDLPADAQIEVVATTDILDLDGNRLKIPTGGVIGSFTTVAATADPAPGVVATFPPTEPTVPANQADDYPAESDIVIVWSEAIDTGTVFPAGLLLGVADTTTPNPPLPFTLTTILGLSELAIDYPSQAGNRVGVFRPNDPLGLGLSVGIVATSQLKGVGGQALDPLFFGLFQTLPFLGPQALRFGTTPPASVNLANRTTVPVEVDLDASAEAGDQVVLVVQEAAGVTGLTFTEDVSAAGVQTISFTLDLTDGGGNNQLADGNLVVGAYLARRNIYSRYLVGSLLQDTVAPALLSLGPPQGTNQMAFLTTLESPAIYGQTSEGVVSFEVTSPGGTIPVPPTTPLKAEGSFFVLSPIQSGRLMAAEELHFVLTDAAGNRSTDQVGSLAQRGVLSGDTSGGSLSVQVYHAQSFAPVVQADVLIEEGAPGSHPGSEQVGLTDTQGEAVFSVTPGARHTVTVHARSFDLTSVFDSAAGYLSLPLMPTVAVSSSVSGTLTQSVGNFLGIEDIRVGVNATPDPLSLGLADVENPSGSSATLSVLGVAPNRLLFLTAFRTFFPIAGGSPISFYDELLGISPVQAGGSRSVAFAFPPAPPTALPWGPYLVDFSGITDPPGFASSLAADPMVDVESAVRGFDGSPSFGIGGASGAAPLITVAGSVVVPEMDPALIEQTFFLVQAVDTAGNLSRGRPDIGTAQGGLSVPLPALPNFVAGGGTYPFAFSFADSLGSGSGLYRVRFTDSDPFLPRSWTIYLANGAGPQVGATMPQITSPLTNLASGTWTMRVDAIGMPAGFSFDDFSLSELERSYRSLAQPKPTGITVTGAM